MKFVDRARFIFLSFEHVILSHRNDSKRMERIVLAIPLLQPSDRLLQLLDRARLLHRRHAQPFHDPDPISKRNIRISQFVAKVVPVVAVLVQPSFVAGDEVGQGFGVELGRWIRNRLLDRDLPCEAVIVQLKVDVECY